jgi:hypothetical protein
MLLVLIRTPKTFVVSVAFTSTFPVALSYLSLHSYFIKISRLVYCMSTCLMSINNFEQTDGFS